MKATREQAWDLAKASGLTGYELSVGEFERLVHLAQQFTLDQLRRGEVIKRLQEENAALRAELSALKAGDVVMVPNWIPVADRLPKGGYPVLVACGKKIIRAAHAGKFELDEENWGWFNGGEGGDYNEANDTYYWPEGWYEWNEFEETHWQVESDPTHWMPLPAAPGVQAGEKPNA